MIPGGVENVLARGEAADLQFPFPFDREETSGSRLVALWLHSQ